MGETLRSHLDAIMLDITLIYTSSSIFLHITSDHFAQGWLRDPLKS